MNNNCGEEIITMKQYTKPTVSVVELSVKESIAKLPDAIAKSATSTIVQDSAGANVLLTTYNLAAVDGSNGADA